MGKSAATDRLEVVGSLGQTAYRVLRRLGSGGMGAVYEVEHGELGRPFVLKILHAHLAGRPDIIARMRNEWRALAEIDHSNVVRVVDAGYASDGRPFYVMERLMGETLAALLARSKRLAPERAGVIVSQVLVGLVAVHERGVVHRDIKPENVFLVEGGRVKLLDFGIAKCASSASGVITGEGVTVGTPRFMAPEQAAGEPVDGRADIYATALLLYQMLAGRGPFAHLAGSEEIALAQILEEPPRVDWIAPDVPGQWGDLLERWLSKRPEDRPPSAAVARLELDALLEEQSAGVSDGAFTGGVEAGFSSAVTRLWLPRRDHGLRPSLEALPFESAPRAPFAVRERGRLPWRSGRPGERAVERGQRRRWALRLGVLVSLGVVGIFLGGFAPQAQPSSSPGEPVRAPSSAPVAFEGAESEAASYGEAGGADSGERASPPRGRLEDGDGVTARASKPNAIRRASAVPRGVGREPVASGSALGQPGGSLSQPGGGVEPAPGGRNRRALDGQGALEARRTLRGTDADASAQKDAGANALMGRILPTSGL